MVATNHGLLNEQIRIMQLECALRDAIEGMEDMLPYVPVHSQERWGHQEYIDDAKRVLADK